MKLVRTMMLAFDMLSSSTTFFELCFLDDLVSLAWAKLRS